MLGDLKPGEKPFVEVAAVSGIYFCEECACHYLDLCPKHPSFCCIKVNWHHNSSKKDKEK